MKLFGKDLNNEVAVVAEVGVNHEGDVDVACRLVRAAADAGADAVKFQSYTPERFVGAVDAARMERVTRFGLDEAAHRRLAAEAERAGIAFFSAAISEDWVPLIAQLSDAVKIASGDLDFEVVIKAAAETGKTVVLSTGAGDIEEVDRAVGWVEDVVGSASLVDRLVLMHCVSAYPAPIEECNLRVIPMMAARYGIHVGWSNHVLGPEACLAAVALGANVIEVHVTDNKQGRTFRDHELSFEPAELAALVTSIAFVRLSLGTETKQPSPSELVVRDAIRKGVVAARELKAGDVLAAADLMYARPATHFPSAQLGALAGRRLSRDLKLGECIEPGALESQSAQ